MYHEPYKYPPAPPPAPAYVLPAAEDPPPQPPQITKYSTSPTPFGVKIPLLVNVCILYPSAYVIVPPVAKKPATTSEPPPVPVLELATLVFKYTVVITVPDPLLVVLLLK